MSAKRARLPGVRLHRPPATTCRSGPGRFLWPCLRHSMRTAIQGLEARGIGAIRVLMVLGHVIHGLVDAFQALRQGMGGALDLGAMRAVDALELLSLLVVPPWLPEPVERVFQLLGCL